MSRKLAHTYFSVLRNHEESVIYFYDYLLAIKSNVSLQFNSSKKCRIIDVKI